MPFFYILTICATVVLLYSVWSDLRVGQWVAKPLAAAGFIGVAVSLGGWDSTYGRWVVIALLFSWGGDVLLIPKDSSRAFLLGLCSFLLGHVGYVIAFFVRGVQVGAMLASAVVLAPVLFVVWHWLRPHVGSMRVPVICYMVVITSMVAAALGTIVLHGDSRILLGAVLFYLSDLAVARQRFVVRTFANPLFGLPLYFGGQLILASTVAQ